MACDFKSQVVVSYKKIVDSIHVTYVNNSDMPTLDDNNDYADL